MVSEHNIKRVLPPEDVVHLQTEMDLFYDKMFDGKMRRIILTIKIEHRNLANSQENLDKLIDEFCNIYLQSNIKVRTKADWEVQNPFGEGGFPTPRDYASFVIKRLITRANDDFSKFCLDFDLI